MVSRKNNRYIKKNKSIIITVHIVLPHLKF